MIASLQCTGRPTLVKLLSSPHFPTQRLLVINKQGHMQVPLSHFSDSFIFSTLTQMFEPGVSYPNPGLLAQPVPPHHALGSHHLTCSGCTARRHVHGIIIVHTTAVAW